MAPRRGYKRFQGDDDSAPGYTINPPVNTDPAGGLHTGSLSTGALQSTAGIALANPPLPAPRYNQFASAAPVVVAGNPGDAVNAVRQANRSFGGAIPKPGAPYGKTGQVAAPPDQLHTAGNSRMPEQRWLPFLRVSETRYATPIRDSPGGIFRPVTPLPRQVSRRDGPRIRIPLRQRFPRPRPCQIRQISNRFSARPRSHPNPPQSRQCSRLPLGRSRSAQPPRPRPPRRDSTTPSIPPSTTNAVGGKPPD